MSHNIEVEEPEKLYFSSIFLCMEASKSDHPDANKLLDKGWDIYRYAKSKGSTGIHLTFLPYVKYVMTQYFDNKLEGSKFSNWNALMILIAEARKYKNIDFDVNYLYFEQNLLANKDPVPPPQLAKEVERLVSIMNTIEPIDREDYIYGRMGINGYYLKGFLHTNKMTEWHIIDGILMQHQ